MIIAIWLLSGDAKGRLPAGTRHQKDVDMKSNDVYRLEFDYVWV